MTALTSTIIDSWADDSKSSVALHLKQKLLPIEGEGGVVFPPTYANIGYNIDTLSDGTKVVTIDSVGSQANRMEPIFKAARSGEPENPFSRLVPQIEIELHEKDENGKKYVEKRSLLDLAHRSADALVHSSPELSKIAADAYLALKRGDAGPLCSFAPTSLVFGVWDSRGGSGEKRPRLVRSIVRAWDVDPLFSAAQFNSVWKSLSSEQQDELEKESKAKKIKLSEKGFADAPVTFRKVSQSAAKYMPEFRDGEANPNRRVLGGVRVNGQIERHLTINLVALRTIHGSNPEQTQQLRRYLLSLALVASTTDIEFFLREGCNLRIADSEQWLVVNRRGEPTETPLSTEEARKILLEYADNAAKPFRSKWPNKLVYKFDLKEAKRLLAKKDDEETEED